MQCKNIKYFITEYLKNLFELFCVFDTEELFVISGLEITRKLIKVRLEWIIIVEYVIE